MKRRFFVLSTLSGICFEKKIFSLLHNFFSRREKFFWRRKKIAIFAYQHTPMKKKVLVGMSGGIDSTATCLMLLEQGYDVVGLTMRVFDVPSQMEDGEPRSILEARSVARRLGIEHFVADEREAFRGQVVDYFCNEYLRGRTPNPCVMCNPLFKFRVLSEWASRLGCEHIATGHYVRLRRDDNVVRIVCGADKTKDQSYFLWRLSQDVLRRCLFPLGEWTKADVRNYLEQKDFSVKAHEGESMEVCFIEGDYRDFLRTQRPDVDSLIGEGKFVDKEGRVLGVHKGFPFYTIGQRKGLGIALGKPAFVLRINADKNTVVLGDEADLASRYMLIEGSSADILHLDMRADNHPLTVRIRYRSKPLECEMLGDVAPGLALVRFVEPASGITPGQSAVFYRGETLVGGAFIASQKGLGQYVNNYQAEKQEVDNI